ncbi:hypothetical protein N657DRAFT_671640 [Parathielavia appendiculata]|uniref:VWFA domain-containing protein n=1 Tax=Parathielavia appendiculata TaxID=2587402 RepID=A0AAN6U1A5_9PEZI|nr:hypothetical protein N657DRAFT_671640 [Parathielavia appendiculata]
MVQQELAPNSSFNLDKHICTPKLVPELHVVLLVDATGSMGRSINHIKANLCTSINAVDEVHPNTQFAMAPFQDLKSHLEPFTVVQDLTSDVKALQEAATRRATIPSGGHSQADVTDVLKKASIRVLGVKVGSLDSKGQATHITEATGGTMLGSEPDAVTKRLLTGSRTSTSSSSPSGASATLIETFELASNVTDDHATLSCSICFLLNGASGGDAFVQKIEVAGKQPVASCFTCSPFPGQNKCHKSTVCNPPPFGNMCLAAPRKKADNAADDDVGTQRQVNWLGPNQHRVALKPSVSAKTDCGETTGPKVCDEIPIAKCEPKVSDVVVEN